MKHFNIHKFGIAVASSFVLVYLLCIILRQLGLNAFIYVSNLIFHGLDLSSVIRNTMVWTDTLFGITLFSALGYVIGVYTAGVYNYLNKK